MSGKKEQDDHFNARWEHVMQGLDRAVQWVKINKGNLNGRFSFHINRETGIEINLGYIFEHDSERLAEIRKLFKGKRAIRTQSEREVHIRLNHDDLIFKWNVLSLPADPNEPEEISI